MGCRRRRLFLEIDSGNSQCVTRGVNTPSHGQSPHAAHAAAALTAAGVMGVRKASAHAFFLRAPIPFSLSASAIWRRRRSLGPVPSDKGLADERGEKLEGARGGVLGGAIANLRHVRRFKKNLSL